MRDPGFWVGIIFGACVYNAVSGYGRRRRMTAKSGLTRANLEAGNHAWVSAQPIFSDEQRAQIKKLAAGYETPGAITLNDVEFQVRASGSPGGLTVKRTTDED